MPPFPPERIIALGASTGGTEALKDVLLGLPADAPPVLIAQHMPEQFTGSFAKRLDTLCPMAVKEATHQERIRPGVVYIAPGHSHLELRRGDQGYTCHLHQGPPVNRHRPSVDVLFHSVAAIAKHHAAAALLTGMGKDGALGLLALHQAGAHTVAQDEDSCVVYGMPREAAALGAANEILPLDRIAASLMRWMQRQGY